MNQRPGITYRKINGFSLQGLRNWALLFALCGVVGDFILGRFLIPYYGDAVPEWMEPVAAITSVLYYCGIPLFAYLLVQGFCHTSSLKNYALRVAGVAILAEIPFNMAKIGTVFGAFTYSGGIRFDLKSFSLNPIFGILLAMVVLYLFRYCHGTSLKNVVLRLFIWFMAYLWAGMLRIEDANILLTIVPVVYLFRRKKGLQILFGCIATFLTIVFFISSPDDPGNFTASVGSCIAPLTFLMIHFYNGEQGDGRRVVNYLTYPAMLLAAGLLRFFGAYIF